MKNIDTTNIKKFATPITIGSFVLMAVTGILMFFHANIALNKLAHEWFGFVFVAGGIFHLFSHYRSFFKYLAGKKSLALILIFIVALAASFFPIIKEKPSASRLVMKSVNQASLAQVIELSGKNEGDVLQKLSDLGYVIADSKDQTIEKLSQKNSQKSKEIISAIFE